MGGEIMFNSIFHNLSRIDSIICIKVSTYSEKLLLDRFMYWASWVGDGYAYGLIGLFLFVTDTPTALKIFPPAAIAFGLQIPGHKLLKILTKRNRPFEMISSIKIRIKPPDKFSFPSGHTAGAFIMATLISVFYPAWTIPGYILASLVGISRVYNGVHFPTDVIAGILLGLLCANIGLIIS